MALWLIRTGLQGQFEQKFLNENRTYVTWYGLNQDISRMKEREELIEALAENEPDAKHRRLINHASQVWPFAHAMKRDDLAVMPSKLQPVIYIEKTSLNIILMKMLRTPFSTGARLSGLKSQ